MNTVISIKIYLQRKKLTQYIDKVINSDLTEPSRYLIDYPELFINIEKQHRNRAADILEQNSERFKSNLKILRQTLATEKHCFKFPGVTNLYKNLNPVLCIFNELEKLILIGNKKDKKLKWLKSLFKDKCWKSLLINSINSDVVKIETFLKEQDVNSIIEDDIMLLNHLRVRLLTAKKLFKTLS